jgi:hypothetical protein
VSAGLDGTVRMMQCAACLPVTTLLSIAASASGRELSAAERHRIVG